MDKSEVIKELSLIKHNCNQITIAECMNGMCPYCGKKEPLKQGYKFQCLWEDLGMNMPCEWEVPEEV